MNLLDRKENVEHSTIKEELKAYEQLVHYWVDNDDYYVRYLYFKSAISSINPRLERFGRNSSKIQTLESLSQHFLVVLLTTMKVEKHLK